jgi:hypothetical protein
MLNRLTGISVGVALLGAVVACTGQEIDRSGTELMAAGEEARAKGVDAYLVTAESETLTKVELFDVERAPLGTMRIDEGQLPVMVLEYVGPAGELALRWDLETTELEIAAADGQVAWLPAPGEGVVVDERSAAIRDANLALGELMGAVYVDFDPEVAELSWLDPELLSDAPLSVEELDGAVAASSCRGRWHRGWAVGRASRSACCARATAHANSKCKKASKARCCSWRSCDAWCQLGDYLCAPCGRSGKARR